MYNAVMQRDAKRKRRWGNYSTMKSVLHKLYTPTYGAFNAYLYGVENYMEYTRHYSALLKATALKDDEVCARVGNEE